MVSPCAVHFSLVDTDFIRAGGLRDPYLPVLYFYVVASAVSAVCGQLLIFGKIENGDFPAVHGDDSGAAGAAVKNTHGGR